MTVAYVVQYNVHKILAPISRSDRHGSVDHLVLITAVKQPDFIVTVGETPWRVVSRHERNVIAHCDVIG